MAEYGFQVVAEDDLPMLADWLRQEAVSRWWKNADMQIAEIREHISDPGIALRIVTAADAPIAYVQHYPAARWPAPHFAGLPPDSVAIDLFSGPQGFGHGGRWLRQLGDMLLRRVSTLAIDPTPENSRAIGAYQHAGFTGDVIRPDAEGNCVRVMTRRR
ncbi:GNAT family N-acetyltransferase [Paracoccus sediminicola]|uniref:GNAT family N-acetyltransferase n=1 Tax=Paracoccus sediminicola TaxID=3017783 RepID=UPI0022F125FE|nr:GNAT family N-acetyltransferase [Paracoccus sediminicola]WBU56757.1 GNAT family N-acetyltransferase [Paracoccus sediminicola]